MLTWENCQTCHHNFATTGQKKPYWKLNRKFKQKQVRESTTGIVIGFYYQIKIKTWSFDLKRKFSNNGKKGKTCTREHEQENVEKKVVNKQKAAQDHNKKQQKQQQSKKARENLSWTWVYSKLCNFQLDFLSFLTLINSSTFQRNHGNNRCRQDKTSRKKPPQKNKWNLLDVHFSFFWVVFFPLWGVLKTQKFTLLVISDDLWHLFRLPWWTRKKR